MPRVLRILNRFNLGGPTYNAAYLTKYMFPEYETILIGGKNGETEKNSEYIVKNLDIKPLIIKEMERKLSLKKDIIAYNKIKEIIKRTKPDIVHTHASKSGALGRFAAIRLKVPIIIHTFHGHVFDAYFSGPKAKIYLGIEKYLARKSSKIIAVSENQKHDLVENYKICEKNKVQVVSLGFDLSKFQEKMDEKRINFRKIYNLDKDEIAIAIVGRIVPIKNHSLFIEAINYVKNHSSKKIRAFIVGDGESRQDVEKYCKNLNLDYVSSTENIQKATITFTSWEKNVDFIMAGADIIALTSLNEGTPVSLIEAQASNKPIVSTNVGGICNVVIPNKTALLSDIDDKEQFCKNLLKLVENEKLRNELSCYGWDFVKEKYHYTRLVNDMKNLYDSLIYSIR